MVDGERVVRMCLQSRLELADRLVVFEVVELFEALAGGRVVGCPGRYPRLGIELQPPLPPCRKALREPLPCIGAGGNPIADETSSGSLTKVYPSFRGGEAFRRNSESFGCASRVEHSTGSSVQPEEMVHRAVALAHRIGG